MNDIAIVITLLAVVLVVGSSFLRAVGKVRYSLRDLMVMVLCAGACLSMISAGSDPLLLTLGIFGMIVWIAVLIAAVARANIRSPDTDGPEGEPPHGPGTDR